MSNTTVSVVAQQGPPGPPGLPAPNTNILYYLNSATGNDALDGLTIGTAWETWSPVAALVANGAGSGAVLTDVTPGGGSFSLGSYGPDATQSLMQLPAPLPGSRTPALGLQGVWVPAVVGTFVVTSTSTVVYADFDCTKMNVSGTPFPTVKAGAAGWRVRMLSGASAGRKATIGISTSSSVTLQYGVLTISNGDTFVIEKCGTTLVAPASAATDYAGFDGSGGLGSFIADGVRFASADAASPWWLFNRGRFMLGGCEIDNLTLDGLSLVSAESQGSWMTTGSNASGAGAAVLPVDPTYPIQPDPLVGLYVHDQYPNYGGLTFIGARRDGCNGERVQILTVDSQIQMYHGHLLVLAMQHFASTFSGAAVLVDNQEDSTEEAGLTGVMTVFPNGNAYGLEIVGFTAWARLYNFQIVGTVYARSVGGLTASHQARIQPTSCTGTAADMSGVAILLQSGSTAQMYDMGYGPTASFTGAGGAWQVGANAVATMANVASGAHAYTCDFLDGQSDPQFCTVTQ